MNVNTENFNYTKKPKIFNQPEYFIEGWYWVIPSKKLKVREIKPVTILGRELVIYRGEDRQAIIFDAYCPHFGAHLGEGTVEGNELRCFFHDWKYDAQGFCVEVPCLDEPVKLKAKTWPTAEKYGLVWIWTGETPQQPLPFIPELELEEFDSAFGKRFITNCHPNVFMINAVDVQYFNRIHKLLSEFNFVKQEINENAITFNNATQEIRDDWLIKIIRNFTKKPVNYSLCYWYGTTVMMTIGMELLHLNIIFASRLIESGKAEVMTIFITKKRHGIFGRIYNRFLLWLSKLLAKHLLKNDPKIFQTIRFNLKSPIEMDQPIINFIHHLERQKALKWCNWNVEKFRDSEVREIEKRQKRDKWHDELVND